MPKKVARKKRCPVCGTKFAPRIKDQIYCHRRCFKQGYREKKTEVGPTYVRCQGCKKVTRIRFDPINDGARWFKWKCRCGYRPCLSRR